MTRWPASVLALAALVGCGGSDAATVSGQAAKRTTTGGATTAAVSAPGQDWPIFGRTASRPSSGDASIGIGAADAPRLVRRTVRLPGTVDEAPIFLSGVRVGRGRHDVFVMTTTYGRSLAMDAASGRILWTFTPASYAALKGTYRITTATPAASPDRRHVFTSSPDGLVHKLALATGREAPGRWPVAVTRLPSREKITSPFNFVGGRLVVATGGYIGDQPPYQGHVVAIDPGGGRILAVFNTLCADVHRIIDPRSCPETLSAIWARGGVVRAPDGSLLLATGNGAFDARANFGDSVVRISGDGRRLLGSWTPPNQAQLEASDGDLGSTAPTPIGGGSVLQGGKEGKLVVLSLATLGRVGNVGGELQSLPTPGRQPMFTAPAVWRTGGRTLIFVSTGGGTAAFEQTGGRLRPIWENATAGTSPMVAGGLLYVYDPGGALVVYRPQSGAQLARLPARAGHWSSPVPGRGVIALPEGDANEHLTSGTLSLYRR